MATPRSPAPRDKISPALSVARCAALSGGARGGVPSHQNPASSATAALSCAYDVTSDGVAGPGASAAGHGYAPAAVSSASNPE
eukprot:359500-Chlamydomonas_euryale.AAC.7